VLLDEPYRTGLEIPAQIRWENISGRGSITVVNQRAFDWEIRGGLLKRGVRGRAHSHELRDAQPRDGFMLLVLDQTLLTVETEPAFVRWFMEAKAEIDARLRERQSREESAKREFIPPKLLQIGSMPTAEQILLFQVVNQLDLYGTDDILWTEVGSFLSLNDKMCEYCEESSTKLQPADHTTPVLSFRYLDEEFDDDGQRKPRKESETGVGVCLGHMVQLSKKLGPLLYEQRATSGLFAGEFPSFEDLWAEATDPDLGWQPLEEIRQTLNAFR